MASTSSSVVDSLKRTPKGKLTYGGNWVSPHSSSAESSFNHGLNDSFRTAVPASTLYYSPPCRTESSPSSCASPPGNVQPECDNVRRQSVPTVSTKCDGMRPPVPAPGASTAGNITSLVSATSNLSIASGSVDERGPSPAESGERAEYRMELRQQEQQLQRTKRKNQAARKDAFDAFAAENKARKIEAERENQQRTLRRWEDQRRELEELEQQMERERRQSDAECERKSKQHRELDQQARLEAEEAAQRSREAQRRVEEEERQKQFIARVATALVAQCSSIADIVTGSCEVKYLPQAGLQQLVDKLRRTQTAARKIAESPLIGDEAELKKLPPIAELTSEAEQLIAVARQNIENEQKLATEKLQQQQQQQQSAPGASTPKAAGSSAASRVTPASTASPVLGEGAAAASPVKTSAETTANQDIVVPEIWRGALTPSTCPRYLHLTNVLSSTEDKLAAFKADVGQKPYRDLLSRVIITAVNTVSSQSAQHMLDKVQRMLAILGGQTVTVGSKSVSADKHPDAKLYCTSILAQHIVMQGEKQIASHAESAFPFAAVVIGVWDKNKLFGDLMLAHLSRACPVSVPFYPPRLQGQSEAEYLRTLGFRTKDGKPETNDQFATRMMGFMRLYAAILQSTPPPNISQNPHGIGHAWTWLARVMNLQPRATVSATAVCALLEMAGHAMKGAFRSQFDHLLHLLSTTFLARVQRVTQKDDQGPLERLRQTLEEAQKRGGRFKPPEGHLPPSYWTTRDYNEPTAEQLVSGTAFAGGYY